MTPVQLPPPLAPWAALLEIFPTDLARQLGPLVQRLDVAIGPLRARHRAGQGEPDGYDGLSRRGLYERLLVSEWLLADELPEEFARRAAMGEHAFLKLARREPARARSCVALFDVGPSQLGTPRLAHLAALIVLARRAALAGARFEWGLLQEETRPLFDEITPHNIETWLQARTVQSLSEEALAKWRENLNATTEYDDFWLLGGRDLEQFGAARGASLFMAEDALEIETRTLQVQIKMAQRSAQNIILELPEEAVCARLLREPFGAVGMTEREWRKVSPSCAPQSNLIFADASRLLARNSEGIVVYQIPKSAKGGMPRPKRYAADVENLVAAGMYGKAVMVVTKAKDSFYTKATDGFHLLCLNKQTSPFDYGPYGWTGLSLRNSSPEFSSHLAPLFFVEGGEVVPVLWLPQAKDQCLLRLESKAKKTSVVAFLVANIIQPSKHYVLYAVSNEKGCKIITFEPPDKFQDGSELEAAKQVFFFGDSATQANPLSTAIAKMDGSFSIPFRNGPILLNPPTQTHIIGAIYLVRKWQEPGLVCLSTDRRSIAIWGRIDKRVEWNPVLRASEEILHVTVCPTAPRIAYATAHELAVYCLEREEILLRVRWEDE